MERVLSIDGKFSNEFVRDCRLAKGGYGQVFKAISKTNNKVFAVKRILLENANYKESFEREVEILTKLPLNCEYVVNIYSYWLEPNDFAYTQMELCHGDLKSMLENKNQYFRRETANKMNLIEYFISFEILREVTECLNFLHSQTPPIMHRDLKPANILITENRNGRFLKLCDFGQSIYHEKSSHSRQTGTMKFIAPEVLSSRKYNLKADIYSLGITAINIFETDLQINLNQTELVNAFQNNSRKISDTIMVMQLKYPDDRPNCPEVLEKLKQIIFPLNFIKRFNDNNQMIEKSDNFFYNYYISRFENHIKV